MRKLVAVLSVVWFACGLGCESGGLLEPPARHPESLRLRPFGAVCCVVGAPP